VLGGEPSHERHDSRNGAVRGLALEQGPGCSDLLGRGVELAAPAQQCGAKHASQPAARHQAHVVSERAQLGAQPIGGG
jgi:hypothetical protein